MVGDLFVFVGLVLAILLVTDYRAWTWIVDWFQEWWRRR